MRAVVMCRRSGPAALAENDAALLERLLTPDNLEPRARHVRREHGAVCALFNPPSTVQSKGASVCLGGIDGGAADAFRPGAPLPHGAHALIRVDERRVELLADAVASRTIWYLLTRGLFIASTSQRAIAVLAGVFEPSREAVAWMLCTGTLGTAHGWDARVGRVPPGGRVTLNRTHWRLAVKEAPIKIAAEREAERLCLRRVEDAIDEALARFRFDPEKWILPLSGGVDSRGLLLLLKDRARLQCVTWGVESALADPLADPAVAARLAARVGAPHRFFPIAVSDEPRERLIESFLVAGEGRTDQISGYLDGFSIWRTLAAQRYDGVIRGDEAFGWVRVGSESEVRRATGFPLPSEALDPDLLAAFDLPVPGTAAALERREGESLETWRDRAYQGYRLPTLLAALTDLKCAYVEVLNPLLFNRIVECVRSLPDRYRTEKRLWRKIVTQRSPAVPFARRAAVFPLSDFVRDEQTLRLVGEEIESEAAQTLLGPDLAAALRAGIEATRAAGGRAGRRRARALGRSKGARLLEKVLRRLGGRRPSVRFAPELIAFRAFLALRICAKLKSDAGALDARDRSKAERRA
ncbi:MAG TPA: hypothetical protein VFV10_03500 [Gammaproteobacteria bacterium]|nr:hypothetical protein [Gammaproteobacteria bacterium]